MAEDEKNSTWGSKIPYSAITSGNRFSLHYAFARAYYEAKQSNPGLNEDEILKVVIKNPSLPAELRDLGVLRTEQRTLRRWKLLGCTPEEFKSEVINFRNSLEEKRDEKHVETAERVERLKTTFYRIAF